ncbi:hypothetical protein OSB04_012384 [Centaurea solstitialis]|uniref:5'-deoxynucleotidase n=1 Tax=Centaurea solstitialis TaxID=347529 RepID=A0AA38TN03_9ASTR|nr:hypothetical protein OSB04_012384 [Centaurea solstitialis]
MSRLVFSTPKSLLLLPPSFSSSFHLKFFKSSSSSSRVCSMASESSSSSSPSPSSAIDFLSLCHRLKYRSEIDFLDSNVHICHVTDSYQTEMAFNSLTNLFISTLVREFSPWDLLTVVSFSSRGLRFIKLIVALGGIYSTPKIISPDWVIFKSFKQKTYPFSKIAPIVIEFRLPSSSSVAAMSIETVLGLDLDIVSATAERMDVVELGFAILAAVNKLPSSLKSELDMSTKRAGWVKRDIKGPESIADHMYRMGLMALIASDAPGVNRDKCIKMAIVHDIAEAIVGDITPSDGVPKLEKSRREKEALDHMCKLLGGGPRAEEIYELWMEYEENSTKEAKVVKDFDKLEMILQALEYENEQDKDLEEFFQSTAGKFQTDIGKAWASEIASRRKKQD